MLSACSLLLPALSLAVYAQEAVEPELLISHFKITSSNGQFVELYNNSDTAIDLATVQIAYYNNYDLTKATSSKQIALSGILDPGGYFILNDSALTLCYRMMLSSQSLGFSSTAGMVQVLRLSQARPGGPVTNVLVDNVAWSKTAASGAQILPSSTNAFLERRWADNVPKTSGGGSWLNVQPSAANPCELESVTVQAQTMQHEDNTLLPSTLPPVRFVTIAPAGEKAKTNNNKGLMAPLINELLPNPASPQTDADDEYVELYNSNETSFDLSNFSLAFGAANPRKYNFPEGTILAGKSFTTFNSADTSLSLSNEQSQVWLLDQNGAVISQSEPYSDPKEGQAWAMADGAWTWTLQPTPALENVIALSVLGDTTKPSGTVLSISNSSPTGSAATVASANTSAAQLNDAAPLHPLILAGVGAAAVGYAVYEYRQDVANRIFQFRRYLRDRRALR